jgi:hypothetical protein
MVMQNYSMEKRWLLNPDGAHNSSCWFKTDVDVTIKDHELLPRSWYEPNCKVTIEGGVQVAVWPLRT